MTRTITLRHSPGLTSWLDLRGYSYFPSLDDDNVYVDLDDAARLADDDECEVCAGASVETPAVLRLLVGETDTPPHRAPLCIECASQSADGQAAISHLGL